MIWAIGSAATQSSGLVECLGTAAKSISVGNSARQGLWSALLAQRGLKGPAAPIEGRQGYFAAMGARPDWATLSDGLGQSWEILQNAYKPYPAGVVVHPVIDAVLELRAEHAIAPPTISRIVVRGHPLLGARAGSSTRDDQKKSQVSVQHKRGSRPAVRAGGSCPVYRCLRPRPGHARRSAQRSRWSRIRRLPSMLRPYVSGPRMGRNAASWCPMRAAVWPGR